MQVIWRSQTIIETVTKIVFICSLSVLMLLVIYKCITQIIFILLYVLDVKKGGGGVCYWLI